MTIAINTPASLPEWIDPSAWMPLTRSADADRIEAAIHSDSPGERELALMLSPQAARVLEPMAQRARALTRRHFGRTINLYAPLYVSNHCNAGCTYCGFAADRRTPRSALSMEGVRREVGALAKKGLQEVVLLTGERMPQADVPYLADAIAAATNILPQVNIEVFPMKEEEYARLAEAGCHGLTLYQETYDEERYLDVHRWGQKRRFAHRIDAAERALSAGLRDIGIGALLGLSDPRFDMLAVYRHAKYLRKTYWQAGVSVSFPRIRPQTGGFKSTQPLTDAQLAQFICAFRICMPDMPLVLSTREPARIRDGLAGVGISKMSVASKTTVGGYSDETPDSSAQFDISDERGIQEFRAALQAKGLSPVFKNWDGAFSDAARYCR